MKDTPAKTGCWNIFVLHFTTFFNFMLVETSFALVSQACLIMNGKEVLAV